MHVLILQLFAYLFISLNVSTHTHRNTYACIRHSKCVPVLYSYADYVDDNDKFYILITSTIVIMT